MNPKPASVCGALHRSIDPEKWSPTRQHNTTQAFKSRRVRTQPIRVEFNQFCGVLFYPVSVPLQQRRSPIMNIHVGARFLHHPAASSSPHRPGKKNPDWELYLQGSWDFAQESFLPFEFSFCPLFFSADDSLSGYACENKRKRRILLRFIRVLLWVCLRWKGYLFWN